MNNTRTVMEHPSFRSKRQVGRKRHVRLDLGNTRYVFIGHTWTEAFRKAAVALVTERLK
jgi:hypothetical protein